MQTEVERSRGAPLRIASERLPLFGLLLAICGAASANAAPGVRLSQSLDVSSGDYGADQPTNVAVATSAIRVSHGAWHVRITAPFLRVSGPSGVVVDEDGPVGDGLPSGPERRRRSGLGDISLSGGRSFYRLGGGPAYMSLEGRVRLPTGSREKGLGAGVAEAGLSASGGVALKTSGLFISLGRRRAFESIETRRRETTQFSAGGWLIPDPQVIVGGWYGRRSSSVAGGRAPAEVGVFLSRTLNPKWRFDLNGSFGLNKASSDVAVGAGVSLNLR